MQDEQHSKLQLILEDEQFHYLFQPVKVYYFSSVLFIVYAVISRVGISVAVPSIRIPNVFFPLYIRLHYLIVVSGRHGEQTSKKKVDTSQLAQSRLDLTSPSPKLLSDTSNPPHTLLPLPETLPPDINVPIRDDVLINTGVIITDRASFHTSQFVYSLLCSSQRLIKFCVTLIVVYPVTFSQLDTNTNTPFNVSCILHKDIATFVKFLMEELVHFLELPPV